MASFQSYVTSMGFVLAVLAIILGFRFAENNFPFVRQITGSA